MAKKIKISRKEIRKPDEFITWSDQIIRYVEKNTWQVILIAGAVLAAFLIAQGVRYYIKSQTESSRGELYLAQKAISTPLRSELTADQLARVPTYYATEKERSDAAIKHLETLIKDYGSTDSAKIGRYYLARIYYDLGEWDKSIQIYNDFLTTEPANNTALKSASLFGLASCYFNKKEYTKAKDYFQKVVDLSDAQNRSYALISLARCHEMLGQYDKAEEILTKLQKDSPALAGPEGLPALIRDVQLAKAGKINPAEEIKEESKKEEQGKPAAEPENAPADKAPGSSNPDNGN